MAVIINTEPPLYASPYAGGECAYNVTVSDAGTATAPIKFKYRLMYGAAIGDWCIYPPQSNVPFTIDFSAELRQLVRTGMPFTGSGLSQSSNFFMVFYMDWQEIEQDSLTCATNILSQSQTPQAIALNTQRQKLSKPLTQTASTDETAVLSNLPRRFSQCRDAVNEVIVLGDEVLVQAVFTAPTTTLGRVEILVDDICVTAHLHPRAYLTATGAVNYNNVTKMEVKITNPSGVTLKEYTIDLLDCEHCNLIKNYRNILFLDHLGSRSIFAASYVANYGTQSTQDTYSFNGSPNASQNGTFIGTGGVNRNGATVFKKDTREYFTIRLTTPRDAENEAYVRAFLSSPEHHVQETDYDGAIVFRRVIMSAAQINLKLRDEAETEIVFTYATSTACLNY